MFIGLDLETTGLNPKTDHIIEVAVVLFDDEKIHEKWTTLVKPPIPIPAFTTHLTGISNEMVADAPEFKDVLPIIIEKIGSHPIMGHFIFFDVNFLNMHGAGLKNIQLDSCQLAQVLLPKEPSYSLEVLTKKLGIPQPDAHRAINDVLPNIELLKKLYSHLSALSEKEKKTIRPLLEKSDWSWAPYLLPHLEKPTGERMLASKKEKPSVSEIHVNLTELTRNLKSPFLIEEGSHTDQDLLSYGLQLPEQTLLTLPDVSTVPTLENVGILKHPNQYLDENRLDRLLAAERLGPIETMLGIKCKLWLFETQTGEKSELRLIKEENEHWFDICCQESDYAESFFKKAIEEAYQKKVVVISHLHFLKDRSRKNPSLNYPSSVVIGHAEELLETLEEAFHIRLGESRFLGDLHRLKLENPNLGEVIDHLAARVSILFGFIGMFLQKNGEGNDPRHPLVVEPWHTNSMEWNKVRESALSIEDSVAALGNDCKATPTLDEFSRYVSYLLKLLKTPQPILWLTWSLDEQPVVHAFPEHPSELFKERIWNGLQKLHLFTHHGGGKDDFIFIKKELALPEELTSTTKEDVLPLPILFPEQVLAKPNDPKHLSETLHELSKCLPDSAGNSLVLVSSMPFSEQLFFKLTDPIKKWGKKLFVQNMGGGMGKISKMAEETNGKNIFVGNEDFLDFLLKENIPLQLLIIERLPFRNPHDPIQMGRSKAYENPYTGFSLPSAQLRFHGILDRFLGNSWEGKRILILDPRIHDDEGWLN
jgi:DNA polymerase III epsilon subunit-like protein